VREGLGVARQRRALLLVVNKLLRSVLSQGIVERVKQNGNLIPIEGERDGQGSPDEGYN